MVRYDIFHHANFHFGYVEHLAPPYYGNDTQKKS